MRVDVPSVVIPMAAPMGARFGIASASLPHALLPVLDLPLLAFALMEARTAGVARAILVLRPGDAARHAETIALATPEGLDVAMVEQPGPQQGTGEAMLCAAAHALPGPVAVILPDDLILGAACLQDLVERYQRSGAGHLVGVGEVSPGQVGRYGILDPLGRERDGTLRAVGLVEKPAPEDAPSRLAIAGRYVLHPRIFADLSTMKKRDGACLTRAVARGIDRVGVIGAPIAGRWFDCSSPEGLLDAAVALRQHRRLGALRIAAE